MHSVSEHSFQYEKRIGVQEVARVCRMDEYHVYNDDNMIFDWGGLGQSRYFLLIQKNNPLKYCNYALPFPMPIGLPFMPCDLPNEYQLISSDQHYSEGGDIYLTLEEQVNVIQRILMPTSHRPWQITGLDYYKHTPYEGIRDTNCCFSTYDRPTVHVKYQDRYAGKIVEVSVLNCCCLTQTYQQFEVYGADGQLLYRVISRNPQRGHIVILPCWDFDRIIWDIHRGHQGTVAQIEEEGASLMEGQRVGEIVHLFHGLNEYSSKNDKYGICFPEGVGEEEKCLLVYTTLLIDYLLFCNF